LVAFYSNRQSFSDDVSGANVPHAGEIIACVFLYDYNCYFVIIPFDASKHD